MNCDESRGPVGKEIGEPKPWSFEEGPTRRVAVYDHNWSPPRLVRRVGWVTCISCRRQRFFSCDVVKHRMCDGCRQFKSEVGIFSF